MGSMGFSLLVPHRFTLQVYFIKGTKIMITLILRESSTWGVLGCARVHDQVSRESKYLIINNIFVCIYTLV
jgi:hypothetical protein